MTTMTLIDEHGREYTIDRSIVKRCSKCSTVKPLDEFYRDRTQADGRCGRCKSCEREHWHARRQAEAARRVSEQVEALARELAATGVRGEELTALVGLRLVEEHGAAA